MSEKKYLLTWCPDHHEHFYIREWNGNEEVGFIEQIFSDHLAQKIDKLIDLNRSLSNDK